MSSCCKFLFYPLIRWPQDRPGSWQACFRSNDDSRDENGKYICRQPEYSRHYSQFDLLIRSSGYGPSSAILSVYDKADVNTIMVHMVVVDTVTVDTAAVDFLLPRWSIQW